MSTDVYAVLGNRVRARLVLCLSRRPRNVTELIGSCGLAQSAVSQHLAKLKAAGLVACERMGKEVIYSLVRPEAAKVGELLSQLDTEVVHL